MGCDYLYAAFIREFDGFPIEYKLEKKDEGYSLDLIDLPVELDYLLIKLKYNKIVSVNHVEAEYVSYDDVEQEWTKICEPMMNEENRKVLHIDLDARDFAIKMNAISSIIRNFFHQNH